MSRSESKNRLTRRRETERHLSSAGLSLLFHLLLLFLFASFAFAPGSGLVGFGQLGMGEATLRLEDERESELDAEDLLKDIRIDPLQVVKPQKAAPRVPKLRSLGPLPSSSERLESISTRFTVPGGVGVAGDFGSVIGRLRKSGLDVVLIVDSSGSMQHAIDELTDHMNSLVDRLKGLVPTTRIGAVAFRDRGDEYVVRWTDLTFHGKKVKAFLSELEAEGGGDWEEAVLEALDLAIHDLNWRKRSKKVIILVGSSPPHADDMPEILEMVASFHARGGFVSTIDITTRLHQDFERFLHRSLYGKEPTEFSPLPEYLREVSKAYRSIADAGGGEMAGSGFQQELTQQILVFTFGSQWKSQLAGTLREMAPGS